MGGESSGTGILVADDEPLLRRLIERVLRTHGFDVTAVGDGDAALAHVAATPGGRLAAVVVDVSMPPRGGASALQAILARRPDLGVVVTSGVSPDPALRELLRDWHGVFLAKPFAPETLIRAIHDALGQRGQRSSPAPKVSTRRAGE